MGISTNRLPYLRYPGFLRKAVTLSYDDGTVYDRKMIEILDAYGLKCTFNLNSELFLETTGGRKPTKEEAVALYKDSVHEVAVHGAKHLSLGAVPTEHAVRDVIEDRINLEKMFGRVIKGMAYANGSYSDEVVEILRLSGIEYARTVISTEKFEMPDDWLRLPATCHHGNPHLMELAEAFVSMTDSKNRWMNGLKMFYLWGHSYEFNDNDNWEILENFAKFIGNRSDIWYATNGEIYSYVTACKALRFSADGSYVQNPTATDLCLRYENKDIVAEAGKTTVLR